MMRLSIFFKTGILCSSLFLLSGCNQTPHDYDYLMTHPDILKDEANRCQAIEAADASCGLARRATHDFSALVYNRGVDPEGFGSRILKAQTQLAETEQALQRMSGMPKQVMEKDYQQQRNSLEVLLAVVSATTNVSS
jgi:hypothetical protein